MGRNILSFLSLSDQNGINSSFSQCHSITFYKKSVNKVGFSFWILLLNFLIPHCISLAIQLGFSLDHVCLPISYSVASSLPHLWFTIECSLSLVRNHWICGGSECGRD